MTACHTKVFAWYDNGVIVTSSFAFTGLNYLMNISSLSEGMRVRMAGRRAKVRAADAGALRVQAASNRMQFAPRELREKAGQPGRIIVENPDSMPHNLVLVMPGPAHSHSLLVAVLLLAGMFFAPTGTGAPAPRLNILHLHADDQRADGLHALGNRILQTPHLDTLVARGMTFTRCYTMGSMVAAVCRPSRTMMLTGKSWRRIPNAGKKDGDASRSLPKVLSGAGYETLHVGKGGNDYTAGLNAFDTSLTFKTSTTEERRGASERHADAAIEFLRNRRAGAKPFHGLFGKQNLYEFGGMHVPCVIAGPGIPHGRSDAFVYLMDLYPTFCDFGGAAVPAGVEGRSLVPVLQGKARGVRDVLYTGYRDSQRAVRDERWKLIRYPLVDRTQLFDLSADPHELSNLADKPGHAGTVRAMMALLEREMIRHGDTAPLTVANPKPAGWTPPAPSAATGVRKAKSQWARVCGQSE